MTDSTPAARVVTRVVTARPSPSHPAIVAGALDSPLPGSATPGKGIELNGWLIVRPGTEVEGVQPFVDGKPGPLQPLDVKRPDVLADYPAAPSASCGFSFWCPLPNIGSARIQLTSVFASGEVAPLVDLQTAQEKVVENGEPGGRVVTAPDFVIIGTQRGGTTSLHAYLNAHPDIRTPAKKEIHYLTDRHMRGAEWYVGQFPPTVPAGTLVGEATPYALFHPLAAERLRELAPDALIIVLVRNPVERAYSHFLHEQARGHELLTFEEALAAEPERLLGLDEQLRSGTLPASDAHKRASYAARGRYARQLARWFAEFPREQFLILRSEDLYNTPARVTRQVTDFLGIDPLVADQFDTHNATNGPAMSRDARQTLRYAFASENDQLAELLGWAPGWN